MPLDAVQPGNESVPWSGEVVYLCRRCQGLITRESWETVVKDSHEHVVFNPAGMVFRVLCFRDAPGAASLGPASGEFTWFRGYRWRLAACRSCGTHLGWRYEASAEPRVFFALIRDALTTERR